MSPTNIDSAGDWFERNGGRVVVLGRMVPAIRTLISIPAGVGRMTLGRFLLLTTLGSAAWTGARSLASFLLEGHYARVEVWVNPVSPLLVALLALWYVPRLIQFRRA